MPGAMSTKKDGISEKFNVTSKQKIEREIKEFQQLSLKNIKTHSCHTFNLSERMNNKTIWFLVKLFDIVHEET